MIPVGAVWPRRPDRRLQVSLGRFDCRMTFDTPRFIWSSTAPLTFSTNPFYQISCALGRIPRFSRDLLSQVYFSQQLTLLKDDKGHYLPLSGSGHAASACTYKTVQPIKDACWISTGNPSAMAAVFRAHLPIPESATEFWPGLPAPPPIARHHSPAAHGAAPANRHGRSKPLKSQQDVLPSKILLKNH